jgi:tetratricopeptide (TPR) repeat protein
VPETTPAPSGGSSSSTSSAGDLGTENAHRAGRAPAGSGASDQAAEGPTSGATPAAPEDGTTEDARPEDYRRRNGTGAYQEAAQLVETGRPKEGLNAYLRAYDGDLDAAYDIAVLAEELNETEIATFFWQDTASGTGAAAIEAHRVLFQRSLGDLGELARPSSPPTPQERADDTTREPLPASAGPTTGAAARAFDHFRALERAGQLPVQEARLRLAQALLAQDEPSKAQQVLAADSSSSGAPAELLYLLGRSYEEQKRPSRAIEHYRELMDNYVLSSYYEPARERYEYLRRHFLHVR